MTTYGEDRNGQNKICVITGLPGSGKSHLLKEKIIPNLRKNAKKVVCVDPNCEYKPSRGFMVYRIQDYDNAEEEFETMIANDELVEYAKYVNNYYGTPRAYVEEQLNAGKNVILEIEIQGALKVKEKMPEDGC